MVSLRSSLQLEIAQGHLTNCHLCEHRCGANRLAGERGPCKATIDAHVFRHRVECGEEPELIPSHLFYLSGCDLRCAFCIAEANAFDPHRGRVLTGEFFRDAVRWGQAQGARTVQWVGGEPTIHLPKILEVMDGFPNRPPIVWKSDFYATPIVFDLLSEAVSIYVADFKFGNDRCASRIARVTEYVRIVTRNLRLAAARNRVIVRHLLLPGHEECCFHPIVDWLAEHLPDVAFSLRDGYQPRWQAARHAELAYPLARGVGDRARLYARERGLNVIV